MIVITDEACANVIVTYPTLALVIPRRRRRRGTCFRGRRR